MVVVMMDTPLIITKFTKSQTVFNKRTQTCFSLNLVTLTVHPYNNKDRAKQKNHNNKERENQKNWTTTNRDNKNTKWTTKRQTQYKSKPTNKYPFTLIQNWYKNKTNEVKSQY